ncbi:hypothetical protein AM593_03079, partial [Mytilus galloprovincialis]
LDECISKIRHARRQKEAFSIGYHGNILTYDESRIMMHEDPIRFKNLVQE